jgi:flavin-dependent dehydrogenase
MNEDNDVIVVGGGLAGAASAIVLSEAGCKVLLLESGSADRDKFCGEFLSGESRYLLQILGCLDAVTHHGPPEIQSMEFITSRGSRLVVPLAESAMGVSRRNLDRALIDKAKESGTEVRLQTRVLAMTREGNRMVVQTKTGCSSAPLILAAWGRHNPLQDSFKLSAGKARARQELWYGVKKVHRLAEGNSGLSARGQVHVFPGGYCGVSPLEHGRVSVCALVRAPWKFPSEKAALESLQQKSPSLDAVLRGLHPDPSRPFLSVAVREFQPRPKFAEKGQVLFLGDAGGMIAPVGGDGQAMALESGLRLGLLLGRAFLEKKGRERWWDVGKSWQQESASQFWKRMALARWIQFLATNPGTAEILIRGLRPWPWLVASLSNWTRSSSLNLSMDLGLFPRSGSAREL